MATTYKFKTAGVETLTARLYADQIEVYPGHDLESCLRYQWKYDDRINGFVDIVGATSKTYDVDLSTVASSGDYYCEIQVGNTGDCNQVTETRTISIIDCIAPQDVLFTDEGGTGEAIVDAPHYEEPNYFATADGADFITLSNMVPCDASTIGANVCRFVNVYVVDPTTDKAQPREAQITVTIGDLSCFFNIGQDRTVAQAPESKMDPPPAGPFINLSNNGPSLAVGDGIGVPITFTADVGTVGGTGSETYTVAWTDDFGGSGTGLTYEVTNPGPIGPPPGMANPVTVTATVTSDADGSPTATATQIADFYTLSFLFPDPPSLMGDVYGFVNWLGWSGDPGVRTVSGSFTAGGSGNWDASFTLLEGFIDTTSATLTYSLNGPGISINNETLTISGEPDARRSISYTGMSGVYDWEVTISGVQPSTLSRANGSALFTRRFF